MARAAAAYHSSERASGPAADAQVPGGLFCQNKFAPQHRSISGAGEWPGAGHTGAAGSTTSIVLRCPVFADLQRAHTTGLQVAAGRWAY